MRVNHWKTVGRAFCIACMLIFLTANLVAAQNAGGILRGQVTDPSGGAVAGATVLLTTPSGAAMDTVTNKEGIFEFKDLAEGSYEIKSIAQGFSMFTKSGVAVTAGQITRVNIQLSLEEQKEKVEVNSTTTQVDVNPAGNANTVVLQGKDLEALSDDPDELQSELQALAGPSAGPNGGQIYIDGFTAGQLPPKASIREIRINQNPFSSEYDRLGYGRIEIFTKPGTDKLHGQVMFSGNASSFNSRNPFELLPQGTQPPSYHTTYFSGNVGGALSKKASYFFNLENRDIQNLGIVSATVLDASNNIVPYSAAVSNPEMRTNLSPRLDYQLTPNNTLSARYQYWHNTETNSEVGQFTLQALGTKNHSAEHTVQATDTQVVGAHVINESRFQYVHDSSENTPTNTSTTISVGGAFTGNGSGMGGNSSDLQNRIEFQNTTYMNYGKHSWKFGGRIRSTRDVTTNLNNYNGSFFFSSIDQYQQFVEQVAGITPTYYTQTAGKSSFDVNWLDAGLFAQDDWKLRANFTVSYGLRFETQNDFSDKADFAPRLGFAWGIGGTPKNPPKTILRAGFGLFYDRFNYNQVLQQERQGGTSQQGYQVAYQIVNPAFQISDAPLPPAQLTSSTTATIYEPNLSLHAPYTVQTGVTLERQLTKVANLAVTYLNSRGVHQFFTDNLNAYNPVLDQRPQSLDENIFQYQSEGTFKQNQLILNSSIRMGTKLFLFGFYTLNYADSDTSGAGSLASVPGHVQMDYGRASFDVRHRLFMGGTIGMPYGFRFSPFLVASSGIPFNITTGNDPYQSSTFNSRPEFATGACTGLGYTSTKYGCMFTPTTPQDFQSYVPIPVNIAEAPGRFALNFRLSKTFGFGPVLEGSGGAGGGGPMGGGTFGRPGGGGPGRGGPGGGRGMDAGATNKRYALTFSVNVRNAFNNVNLGTPIGNIQSPIFGESNSLAGGPFNTQSANRRIDLQVTFAF